MKKLVSLMIMISISMISINTNAQEKGLDPRIKAIGTMALYGTVGGTLLGAASLAFGTGGRSVAKGASLGLYAGLLFGGYVVVSHALKKNRMNNPRAKDNYYPDATSPYEQGYSEEGQEQPVPAAQFFEPVIDTDWRAKFESIKKTPNRAFTPVFYIPVFNLQF
tara:strand:- start:40370 stop:40861 length:492 start_codon:yes stop_codon:yes gene_type:complete